MAQSAADFVTLYASTFLSLGGITLTSSGDTIILTQSTITGSAFSPATVSANIPISIEGGLSMRENDIFEDKWAYNDGVVFINRIGYNGGTSKTRKLYIGDGRGGDLASFSRDGVVLNRVPVIGGSPFQVSSGTIKVDSSGFLKLS